MSIYIYIFGVAKILLRFCGAGSSHEDKNKTTPFYSDLYMRMSLLHFKQNIPWVSIILFLLLSTAYMRWGMLRITLLQKRDFFCPDFLNSLSHCFGSWRFFFCKFTSGNLPDIFNGVPIWNVLLPVQHSYIIPVPNIPNDLWLAVWNAIMHKYYALMNVQMMLQFLLK